VRALRLLGVTGTEGLGVGGSVCYEDTPVVSEIVTGFQCSMA
jgi:hypothetical protein